MKLLTKYMRALSLLATALAAFSCSPSMYLEASYDSDDMYATHNPKMIAKRQEAEVIAQERLEQRRMEQWARILGVEVDTFARYGEEYNTPFGEKLRAISADSYSLPASYYQYEYKDALKKLSKYDPQLYNASIDYNGELSIEPKYMSSIYGVWSSPYDDPYACIYGYPSIGYPIYGYYSMWGYPYTNYAFGTGFGYSYYNPWWSTFPGSGFGYPGYYGWYSPYYSPFYYPFPGGGGRRSSIVRQASPYHLPSSGVAGSRRADGSTVGRSSSSSYNRSTTYTAPKISTPTRTPSSFTPSRVPTPTIQRNSIGR